MITDSIRLSWRDARMVHTIQTNAGYYGDMGAIGHLDVCVNNGLTQPFCANTERTVLSCQLIRKCYPNSHAIEFISFHLFFISSGAMYSFTFVLTHLCALFFGSQSFQSKS